MPCLGQTIGLFPMSVFPCFPVSNTMHLQQCFLRWTNSETLINETFPQQCFPEVHKQGKILFPRQCFLLYLTQGLRNTGHLLTPTAAIISGVNFLNSLSSMPWNILEACFSIFSMTSGAIPNLLGHRQLSELGGSEGGPHAQMLICYVRCYRDIPFTMDPLWMKFC